MIIKIKHQRKQSNMLKFKVVISDFNLDFIFFFFFFLATMYCMWNFPHQGSNLCPPAVEVAWEQLFPHTRACYQALLSNNREEFSLG